MIMMTDYKNFFEEALSEACEKNSFSDNDQLFSIVKERASNMEKKKSKMKKPAVIAASIAAAAALTVSVGAVSFGLLSEMFTKYFGDSATKRLADDGYIYTAENYAEDNSSDGSERLYPVMGETLEKGIFTAKLLGIAGDTQDPMMLIDITVNDPEIVAASDIIGIYAQTIGTDEFENKRESYGLFYSKGVKDEEDPSLYHVSARVPPLWVTQGEETVFDIVSIHTLGDNDSYKAFSEEYYAELNNLPENAIISHSYYWLQELDDFGISPTEVSSRIKVHDVEMQFRFTLPENVLKEAPRKYYYLSDEFDKLGYEIDGTVFYLCYSEFGAHETYFSLDCGTFGNEIDDNGVWAFDRHEKAMEVAEQFVLTVDGTEYKPDIDTAHIFRDSEGITTLMIKDMCYLQFRFPAVDFENAQSITLSANGVSYEIEP